MSTAQGVSERPAAARRGIPAFAAQVLSGAALLVLLTLHMVAQHFIVPTGLRYYEDVIEKRDGAWLFKSRTIRLWDGPVLGNFPGFDGKKVARKRPAALVVKTD